VFVKIIIHQLRDALRFPISALFRKGEQWAVYVVEQGRARSRAVEIGPRNPSFAEVIKGLAEGAAVVLHPSDRVVDGVRVVRSLAYNLFRPASRRVAQVKALTSKSWARRAVDTPTSRISEVMRRSDVVPARKQWP
jgi:hypothetical protein